MHGYPVTETKSYEDEPVEHSAGSIDREPGRLEMALLGQEKAIAHLAETVSEARGVLRHISRPEEATEEADSENKSPSDESQVVTRLNQNNRTINRLCLELHRILDRTDL